LCDPSAGFSVHSAAAAEHKRIQALGVNGVIT
jgi:hypothetical protein